MSNPRFAYFGTPYVARDTLAMLAAAGFTPAVVITSPDMPRGRGLTLTPSETKAWALAHDIPVLTPERMDPHAIEEIRSYECEYAVVVAYGKILPQPLIGIFPLGILNIHYSLLPKYRGASPVESALLNGEEVTGVTIQKMVFELDAGDILAQKEVRIEPDETTRELRPRLIALGAELLAGVLPSFVAGTVSFTKQNPSEATRCRKIKKEEGLLSLTDDPRKNWSKYRAYAESPGTYFFVERDGKQMRVKITKASLSSEGEFVIERIIPEGKREMSYADFVRT